MPAIPIPVQCHTVTITATVTVDSKIYNLNTVTLCGKKIIIRGARR